MQEMNQANDRVRGGLRSSASLLWRHQRLLWWLFAANLALAWISSLPLRAELGGLLNHSLASRRLVTGFDLGTFFLLLQQPEMQLKALEPGAAAAAAIYLLIALFFDGGLLLELLEDRKAELDEFAAGCAAYFWRMARLAVYSAIVLGALVAGGGAAARFAVKLTDNLPDERIGFAAAMALRLLMLLALLFVRQWFDVAQARVVRDNGRKLLRELWRSFLPALRSGLYWQYLGIGVLAAASFAGGLWLWACLPHAAIGAAFLLLELVTLTQIGARLWMKSASAEWVALQPDPVPDITPNEAAWSMAEAEIEIEAPQPEPETAPEPEPPPTM
jgi:hypothetical protein